jgi:hypothetical protein
MAESELVDMIGCGFSSAVVAFTISRRVVRVVVVYVAVVVEVSLIVRVAGGSGVAKRTAWQSSRIE